MKIFDILAIFTHYLSLQWNYFYFSDIQSTPGSTLVRFSKKSKSKNCWSKSLYLPYIWVSTTDFSLCGHGTEFRYLHCFIYLIVIQNKVSHTSLRNQFHFYFGYSLLMATLSWWLYGPSESPDFRCRRQNHYVADF